ncbi:MAG: hypothetical protein J0I84_23230 [Terrimonas sp.]|nr:hypothetical protein [Terrimonas sp.]OJY90868.1 MAG: hypothetical protein BGP13_12750 [Sphingobacteriales bacterium 40-81]
MKQKNLVIFSLALFLFAGIISCKKEKTAESGNTEISTHSDDQSVFSAEVDAATDDASAALEAMAAFSLREMELDTIRVCGGYITWNLESDPQIATITYTGSNCDGSRSRSGSVTVSVPKGTQWKNAGAAVIVTYNNLKITRLWDQKSITINGSQTYTNVSGGLLVKLSAQQHIIHTIASDGLSITFNNATQRTWKVAKQRDFTYDNGIVLSVSGNHTEGNVENIAEWGTNRYGVAFTTSTVAPLVVRQDCEFRLTSGTVKHDVAGISATVTFGLDASGNPVTCPDNFFYKVVYTGPNGNSLSFILPY